MTTPNLHNLLRQLLIGRTDGLSAQQLAAFIAGWTSLLDVLSRPELCIPNASEEVRESLRSLVEQIKQAQMDVLDFEDD